MIQSEGVTQMCVLGLLGWLGSVLRCSPNVSPEKLYGGSPVMAPWHRLHLSEARAGPGMGWERRRQEGLTSQTFDCGFEESRHKGRAGIQRAQFFLTLRACCRPALGCAFVALRAGAGLSIIIA